MIEFIIYTVIPQIRMQYFFLYDVKYSTRMNFSPHLEIKLFLVVNMVRNDIFEVMLQTNLSHFSTSRARPIGYGNAITIEISKLYASNCVNVVIKSINVRYQCSGR